MRVAYLDCIGGISGDMLLGALLDAGVDADVLVAGLKSLDLPAWELEVRRTQKSGIDAVKVEVIVGGTAAGATPLVRLPPSDSPLRTEKPGGRGVRIKVQHRPQSHEHVHGDHAHSHDGSSTRTFDDVAGLIRASALPDAVKTQAEAVFRRLAEAEASVHGATLETVHFHEVGAVDSIVDVVGSVYGLHLLGVERVVCSPLPNGHGFVRCAHGMMPIPPPATLELLQGVPLRQVDVKGELVTPTGAALASTLAAEFGAMPAMTVRGSGYGAGTKDFPFPNLLRLILGDVTDSPSEATRVVQIETNLDDLSPQLYEAVFEALFAAGALDVWLAPILMKKGRPAHTLSVLCEPEKLPEIERTLFAETTTLGFRYTEWKRTCLAREWREVETPFGTVRIKLGRWAGRLQTATPEYGDCLRLAREKNVPLKNVHAAASAAAWSLRSENDDV